MVSVNHVYLCYILFFAYRGKAIGVHLPVGGAYYIQRHLTEPSAVTSIVDITLNIIHLDKSEKECIGCKILWNLHPLEGPQAFPHIPVFGDMTLQSYANIHTLQGTDRKFIKF